MRWLWATADRRAALALVALCALLTIPFAGNYGLWDPWEGHYGEVARQMLARHDFVSTFWPGSPDERVEFWSKPVLTFWLMALSLRAFGLESRAPSPSEMVDSWRAEWALRMPSLLLGIAAVWATYELTRRIAGRRAGFLAGAVLATSSQWVLVSRQAVTDMAFVAPMTLSLALAGIALLAPRDEMESELPRRRWRRFSWPHAPAFYGFLILLAAVALPQLVMISAQLELPLTVGRTRVRLAGIVPMLPYFAALALAIFWCMRARCRRQLYLFSAYAMAAVATLGKGPAGIAMPGLVLAIFLLVDGRAREILTRLELPRGALLFVAIAFPWYHAMLIRHGDGFWNEFIGDNYLHRAAGRHGDRGGFDYYLGWLGYGLFPWSGIGAASVIAHRSDGRDARHALSRLALIWIAVELTVLTLVNTKFHHYVLPVLPAVAILCGLFLDDLLTAPRRRHLAALALIALPVTAICGRDLAAFPARVLWMFNYDYVIQPGTGRAWPTGERYDYHAAIAWFAVAATIAMIALAITAWRRSPVAATAWKPAGRSWIFFAIGGFLALLIFGIASGPRTVDGAAPEIGRFQWCIPAALVLAFAALLGSRARNLSPVKIALAACLALAMVWSTFAADKMLVELSPHWAQKHVLAAYYRNRTSPDEPLVAWQLKWRGENFYTRNQIYGSPTPSERAVFLNDHPAEKLHDYLASHPHRRIFFALERGRLEALRALLPEAARPTLTVLEDSNNKVYLAACVVP
jgi:4-amino-4-deoxy-L-arabinose transferase-like glycosyltransferase